jgi:hypothetical protein
VTIGPVELVLGKLDQFLDGEGDVVVDASDVDLVDLLADVVEGDDRRSGRQLGGQPVEVILRGGDVELGVPAVGLHVVDDSGVCLVEL